MESIGERKGENVFLTDKTVMQFFYKHQSFIYKIILFLITTVCLVYLFPRSGGFKYSFQTGKPWPYETLLAPFDFPIAKSEEVAEILRKAGFRVKVDARDIHPGQKYYDWEIKGVPLRLDIGPRDIENNTAFAAKRTGGKEPLSMDNISEECSRVLEEISDELRSRAKKHTDNVVIKLQNLDDVEDGKIYEIAFDGTDSHAEKIEKTTGLTFLGDATEPYESEVPCFMSGKPTTRRVLLAKTY